MAIQSSSIGALRFPLSRVDDVLASQPAGIVQYKPALYSCLTMRASTPDHMFPRTAPSSPPDTPRAASFVVARSSSASPAPRAKHYPRPSALGNGTIRATGNGTQFSYVPPTRNADLSPRSSHSSDSSCTSSASISPPRSLVSVSEADPLSPSARYRKRFAGRNNFTIEEVRESDVDMDSDGSIRLPDDYSDASSEWAPNVSVAPSSTRSASMTSSLPDIAARIATDFSKLACDQEEREHEAYMQERRAQRRRNRMSIGSVGKRTITQSIGSDTDDEDITLFDANDAGSSARRLRRRIGDRRSSLIFDDPPPRIVECEEHESAVEDDAGAAAEGGAIEEEAVWVGWEGWEGWDALPYYGHGRDAMDVDPGVADASVAASDEG